MRRHVGLDIGSANTKAVLLVDGKVAREVVLPSMPDMAQAARRAVLEVGGLDAPVMTTGYGRHLYAERSGDVSEVTALAMGIEAVIPGTATVVDMGGQDSKAVSVKAGRVLNFAMNDRCAAGTGRFLEAMGRVLNVPLDRFDEVLARRPTPVPLSSTCAVFAETEAVGLLARGVLPEGVLAGLIAAIASRVAGLVLQVGVTPPVAATGGAMRCRALVEAISEAIGARVVVPLSPLTVTALGAARLCAQRG